MKDFLISKGFWVYKTCGCSGGMTKYKNHAGLEVKHLTRRGEFEVWRNGNRIDNGIDTNYEKINNYL